MQTTTTLACGDYVEHTKTGMLGRIIKVDFIEDTAYVVWVRRKRHTWTGQRNLVKTTKREIEIDMGMYPYALGTWNKKYLRGDITANGEA